MEIEYKGANCIKIKSGSTTIVVDPKLSLVGLKDAKVDGLIEVVTDPEFVVSGGERILIDGPGEYEVGGVSVKGVAAQRNIDSEGNKIAVYRLTVAGFRIAIIGHIKDVLSEAQLEDLGVVDIVAVPVGGNGYTLDAQGATAIVRQIDPKLIIPTHYADKGLDYPVAQRELEEFIKEFGAQVEEPVDKLKLKNNTNISETVTMARINRT